MNKTFEKINKELTHSIEIFESKNGKDFDFNINQNDPILHNMKVKGKLFQNIQLDEEFENADLLDYLGYERIISCKKKDR